MANSDRDNANKTHADLVACLRRIHPKDRIKAIAAALLELETSEKRRPHAERGDKDTH